MARSNSSTSQHLKFYRNLVFVTVAIGLAVSMVGGMTMHPAGQDGAAGEPEQAGTPEGTARFAAAGTGGAPTADSSTNRDSGAWDQDEPDEDNADAPANADNVDGGADQGDSADSASNAISQPDNDGGMSAPDDGVN